MRSRLRDLADCGAQTSLRAPAVCPNPSPLRDPSQHEAIARMWKLVESFQTALLGPKLGDGEAGGASGIMENDRPNSSASPVLGNVDGERVVEKLKGYFSLGKSEIDKAVRADEWGLMEDALLHYRNAHRILSEGVALPAMVESSRFVSVFF